MTSRNDEGERVEFFVMRAAIQRIGGTSAVASLCGVSRQRAALWARLVSVPDISDVLRIARASGVSLDSFARYAESVLRYVLREAGSPRRARALLHLLRAIHAVRRPGH